MAEITLPQLGETVTEGTITRFFKKVGETVAADEPLFEVSTDKVDTEVPSPVAGVLTEIRVAEGDTVAVGTVIAVVGDGAVAAGGASAAPTPEAAPVTEAASPAPASAGASAAFASFAAGLSFFSGFGARFCAAIMIVASIPRKPSMIISDIGTKVTSAR